MSRSGIFIKFSTRRSPCEITRNTNRNLTGFEFLEKIVDKIYDPCLLSEKGVAQMNFYLRKLQSFSSVINFHSGRTVGFPTRELYKKCSIRKFRVEGLPLKKKLEKTYDPTLRNFSSDYEI